MGVVTKPKRTDIQALRAIAVIAVVFYHLWPEKLTGGFMGVDMFFVISGYLMTVTLMRDIGPVLEAKKRLKATGAFLSTFYARRIKRLLPAASVTLLATLGMVLATGNYALIQETAKQIAASALFVQNLYLTNESVDYLSNSAPTAVQHFWSLSLEEQFYLVWPLMLLGIMLLTFYLSISYKDKKIPGAVIPISLLAAAFFIYGYLLTKSDPSAAYFFTPARIWELIIGGLIAFLPSLKNHDLKLLLPWAGFAMVGYALYQWDGSNFPGWHALIPVIGTGLILYGGTSLSDSKFSFANLLKMRPIQWVGDISYSLYLWHWPFIILLPILFTVNIEGERSLIIKLVILALSVVVAWLSFKYIETPSQRIKLQKRWVYAAFVVVGGGIATASMFIAPTAQARADAQLKSLHALVRSTGPEGRCIGARAIENKEECKNMEFGWVNAEFAQMTEIDRYTIPLSSGEECDIYHPTRSSTSDPSKYCVVGDTKSTKTIALMGDSHANQWINAVDIIGKNRGIRILVLTSGNCSWSPENDESCTDRIKFLEKSGVLNDVSAVLLSVWFRYDGNHPVQPTTHAILNVRSVTSAPVYLLEDIPPAGDQGGPDCTLKGMACTNDASLYWAIDSVHQRLVRDGTINQNHIIPTRDMFCDDSRCYSFIGGVPVYQTHGPKDDLGAIGGNSHFTATYSATLSGLLEKRLEQRGVFNDEQYGAENKRIIESNEKNRPSNS